MTTKAFVVAIVGAGTIVAAGAGSYLATRQSGAAVAAEQVAVTASAPEAPAPAPAPPATTATSVPVSEPEPEPVEAAPARRAPESPSSTPAPRRPERPRETPSPATRTAPVEAPVAAPPVAAPPVAPAVAQPPAQVPPPPVEPPKPRFDEVVVNADSVIGIRLDNAISSETARVEDKVTARVSRDLKVDERVAIPSGSHLEGTVTSVDRGGKFRERARLGVRFTTLVIGDTRIPIETDAIFREGESPARESTSKIGASAAVGAILGAVIGGKKGAVIGGTAGAAGGTAAVMAGGTNDVVLAAGTPLTVRLVSPVKVLIERDR